MHRLFSMVSIIGIFIFLLLPTPSAHAQIDLDLLLNSPTPSPLPPGQEYILEIEQLDLSSASDSGQFGALSSSERERFEEQGYIIRNNNESFSFTLDRAHIAFGSFKTAPIQEEQATATIVSENSGFQLIMEAAGAFSSENSTTIPPTRCDSRRTCSPLRAQAWSNEQIPGWGYNLSGSRVPHDFRDKTYYRPPSLDGNISLLKQGEPEKKTNVTFNWKIVTDATSEETYSSVVKLFVLPY